MSTTAIAALGVNGYFAGQELQIGDLVSVVLEGRYQNCYGKIVDIVDDQDPDGPILVEFGPGEESNWAFFSFFTAKDRRVRFEADDIQKEYEHDYDSQVGLNRLFGRMWHTSYSKTACSLVCDHKGCNGRSVRTAWYNCWGCVAPYEVCAEHANYHGVCGDGFPLK